MRFAVLFFAMLLIWLVWSGGGRPAQEPPLAAVAVAHEVPRPHAYDTDLSADEDEQPLAV